MKIICVEVTCVYVRLIDQSTALVGLFLSLPLCSVGHRVNGENIVQTAENDSQMNGLKMFA